MKIAISLETEDQEWSVAMCSQTYLLVTRGGESPNNVTNYWRRAPGLKFCHRTNVCICRENDYSKTMRLVFYGNVVILHIPKNF
jgi:hypothetical protein